MDGWYPTLVIIRVNPLKSMDVGNFNPMRSGRTEVMYHLILLLSILCLIIEFKLCGLNISPTSKTDSGADLGRVFLGSTQTGLWGWAGLCRTLTKVQLWMSHLVEMRAGSWLGLCPALPSPATQSGCKCLPDCYPF